MGKITIVTAYFDINRGNWKKYSRSNDEYFDYFSHWACVNNDLVVYVDSDEKKEKVLSIRQKCNNQNSTIVEVVKDLQLIDSTLLNRISEITNNNRQRSFRFQPTNPEVVNPYYNYIMILKEWCVSDAVNKKYASGTIAWVDFGFNHGGETIQPESFNGFNWEYDFKDKIYMFFKKIDNPDVPIFDVVRTMDVYVMGTVIVAPDYLWGKLWEYAKQEMNSLIDCGLVDDDQTILLMIYRKHRDICEAILSSWNLQMVTCSSSKQLKIIQSQINKPKSLKLLYKGLKWKWRCIKYLIKQYETLTEITQL